MSKFLDSTGLSYFWGKVKSYLMRRNLVPEQSKTYTGVIAQANNATYGYLYYASIKPVAYDTPWRIKIRIHATIAGNVSVYGKSWYDFELRGIHNTYYGWDALNVVNTSYRPFYQHILRTLTATGVTNEYGHLLGMRFYSAYNPATAANSRTFKIDVLETENCTFEFLDNFILYANAPGTGSTNYYTEYSFNATDNGHKMYGDANDANYYVRVYYGNRTTHTALYRYMLCLTRHDKSLLPVTTANNVIATTKELTTESFDPFGDIFYWASTTTYSAGANVGDGWYTMYLADFRYAFNIGGYNVASTLTARQPVYLVAQMQTDGTAKLHTSPLSQTLPSTDDGLIYIYLGQVYPDTYPYRVYLEYVHPVYAFKNGAIRTLTGYSEYAALAANATKVNNHTVEADVPSGAKFTDTTYSLATTAADGLLKKLGGGTTNFLRADGNWANPNDSEAATVSRGSMLHSTDTIWCRKQGSVAIVDFACRIVTAGTYGTSNYLCTFGIKPPVATHGVFMLGSATKVVRVDTSGHLFFNGDTAVTANQWMIGQMVFPLDLDT